MTYQLALQPVGIVVGLVLMAAHLAALLQPAATTRFLTGFPRSRAAGTILLLVAALWSIALLATMDLGEFARLRGAMVIGTAVLAVLAWIFVPEFLAVRALGICLLLAAEPLLCAAFLQPQHSRLLLVVLAYAWVVAGLFYIGMPYLLRDQIQWLTGRHAIFRAAAVAGIACGAAILLSAVLFY